MSATTTTTRKAAIFEPSIPGQWLEDVIGSADYEADAAPYTIVMLSPLEMSNARGALPDGYTVGWAEAGRYGDDTEGAVIVAEDGSVTYA